MPKISALRFIDIKSIVTVEFFGTIVPDLRVTSDIARRIAVGLEGFRRIVSNIARCTNDLSFVTSAASSGCFFSQLNKLSRVRTNAVAEVCAPARRKNAISFKIISCGRCRESSFLSSSVRISLGKFSLPPSFDSAISFCRRAIDGARNCVSNSDFACSISTVTSAGSRVVWASVAPSMNFIMKL